MTSFTFRYKLLDGTLQTGFSLFLPIFSSPILGPVTVCSNRDNGYKKPDAEWTDFATELAISWPPPHQHTTTFQVRFVLLGKTVLYGLIRFQKLFWYLFQINLGIEEGRSWGRSRLHWSVKFRRRKGFLEKICPELLGFERAKHLPLPAGRSTWCDCRSRNPWGSQSQGGHERPLLPERRSWRREPVLKSNASYFAVPVKLRAVLVAPNHETYHDLKTFTAVWSFGRRTLGLQFCNLIV